MSSTILTGDDGDNVIRGGSGDELIYGLGGRDELEGGDGNDTLVGGAGDDWLDGGSGNNVYQFGRGAGSDIVMSAHHAPGSFNVLRLDEGLTPADLMVTRMDDALRLTIRDTGERIELPGYFYTTISAYGVLRSMHIDEIRFADGLRWNAAAVQAQVQLSSSPIILFGDGDDAAHVRFPVDAGGGNDELWGADNGNLLIGGSGNDTLHGGRGSDVLRGGTGDDSLEGGEGDDFLHGGAGADILDSGAGFDTILFGRGDGQDILLRSFEPGHKTVEMAAGILPGAVLLSRSGGDLVIGLKGTDDALTVDGFFDIRQPFQIRFADGSGWDARRIAEKIEMAFDERSVIGGDGNDNLWGGQLNELLVGAGGNDTLAGGEGVNVLVGGSGDDLLSGGSGDDTFDAGTGIDRIEIGGAGRDVVLFGRGSETDTLSLRGPQAQATVMFDAGIAPADLNFNVLAHEDGLLGVQIRGTDAYLFVERYLSPGATQPPAVSFGFADGTLLDAQAVLALALPPGAVARAAEVLIVGSAAVATEAQSATGAVSLADGASFLF